MTFNLLEEEMLVHGMLASDLRQDRSSFNPQRALLSCVARSISINDDLRLKHLALSNRC